MSERPLPQVEDFVGIAGDGTPGAVALLIGVGALTLLALRRRDRSVR